MFNIGDRVTSKKTGLPAIGTVTAILDGMYYVNQYRITESPMWVKHYPDWRHKAVILIKYSIPQRYCSFEEWTACNPPDENNDRKYEYEMIACQPFGYYPIDDLELVEANVTIS